MGGPSLVDHECKYRQGDKSADRNLPLRTHNRDDLQRQRVALAIGHGRERPPVEARPEPLVERSGPAPPEEAAAVKVFTVGPTVERVPDPTAERSVPSDTPLAIYRAVAERED
jgi:hypothetical protein